MLCSTATTSSAKKPSRASEEKPRQRTLEGHSTTSITMVSSRSINLPSSAAARNRSCNSSEKTMTSPHGSKTVCWASNPFKNCKPRSTPRMITDKESHPISIAYFSRLYWSFITAALSIAKDSYKDHSNFILSRYLSNSYSRIGGLFRSYSSAF